MNSQPEQHSERKGEREVGAQTGKEQVILSPPAHGILHVENPEEARFGTAAGYRISIQNQLCLYTLSMNNPKRKLGN